MASGRRISGIYVPVQLDTTQISRDMEVLRQELDTSGAAMMRSLQGNLNPRTIAKGFGDLVKAIGTLRDSAHALEGLKPLGGFEQAIQSVSPELRTLAQVLGITEKAQAELLQRMAETQTINTQVNALRTLERNLGTTREETLQLANAYGIAVSKMAQDKYLGKQIRELVPITSQAAEEFRKLARAAGEMPSNDLFKNFMDSRRIKEAVDAFKQLHPNMQLTRKNYEQIANAAGVATRQVREYIRAQSGMGRGILGAFTPSNLTAGIQSAMGAAGVVGGMYGVVELGKAAVEASLKMDNIKVAFESIYGSSEKAGKQLEFVRDISQKLGLSFVETASGAKQLFASFQGTVLEKDANKIFTAFSNMGAAMRLTGDEMSSVFLAISQMASKGKVSAEELRQQLAERMPGAVTLFAKSIGVSTQQLDKMLQDGAVGLEHLAKFADAVQEKYKAGAAAASTGLQAELNRVGNAWFDLKRAFVDSDALANAVRGIGTALRFVADNSEGIAKVVSSLAKFGTLAAGIYAAQRAILALSAASEAAGGRLALLGKGLSSVVGFLGRFANPVLLGTTALAGMAMAIIECESQMTAGEAAVKKFTDGFDNLAGATDKARKSIEEMNDAEKKVELDRLQIETNKAAEAFKNLFSTPPSMELPTNVVDSEMEEMLEILAERGKSGVELMFNEMRTAVTGKPLNDLITEAQKATEQFGAAFESGIKAGLGSGDLQKILDDTKNSLQALQNEMAKSGGDNELATAMDRVKYALDNAASSVINYQQKLEDMGKATSKAADLAAQATTAFDTISKLTKGSALAKENKATQEIKTMSDALRVLYESANAAKIEMDNLTGAADTNSEAWVGLQGRVDNFDTALGLVASQSIKAGTDFDTMANQLWNAGVQAGFTYEELMKLYQLLQAKFEVQIGEKIQKDLEGLSTKIAMVGAKAADTTAFNILKKYMGDAGKEAELFAAIQTKSAEKVKAALHNEAVSIQDLEKIIQQSTIFGTKSESSKGGRRGRSSGGTSRAKQATQELSAMGKEILSVEKKIGSLQAKYDDDSSIKYWADVNGELAKMDNILSNAKNGTEAERQKLTELRQEYASLAKDRADQMAQEEKRQKAIQAASKFNSIGNQLGDVNSYTPARLQTEALKAQYEENLKDWQDLAENKIITEQEFTDAVTAMNAEMNAKVSAANGEMLGIFAVQAMERFNQLRDWKEQIASTVLDGVETMSDALADFAITGMKNVDDLGEAFSNMVNSMIQDLARLFMKMVIMGTVNKLFGSIFGGATSGQTVGWTTAGSSGGFTGPIVAAAKGAVFAGGDISKYSGSLVTSPTLFNASPVKAFATGGAIMGEKGWEAVFPIKRGSNGKLGIEASGAGASVNMNQKISVNVINNTDSKVSTSQTQNSNGDLDIQVMVERMVGEALTRTGSAPFRALRGVWQGTPALADR